MTHIDNRLVSNSLTLYKYRTTMPTPSNTHFYLLPIIVRITQLYWGLLIVSWRGIWPIPPNLHTHVVFSSFTFFFFLFIPAPLLLLHLVASQTVVPTTQTRMAQRHPSNTDSLLQVADFEEHDVRSQPGTHVEQSRVKGIFGLVGPRIRDHGHLCQLGLKMADAARGLAREAPVGDVGRVAD